jgi:predicted DNA-binding protein (UPF0251 family)
MSRPKKCRNIKCQPNAYYFKPRAIPMLYLEEIVLSIDEFEAIRLADHKGLYHDAAAAEMEISRTTFGRILKQGREKVAEALVEGKALRIESLTYKSYK